MTTDKIRVLVVDDIPETRDNVRKLLFFEDDIEIIGTASNGREGVELTGKLLPDIVLMDINMPEMDGIAASEAIAAKYHDVQVVMMSVQGEADYLRRSRLAGAREFLIKPFSGEELATSIRRVYQLGAQRRAVAPIHDSTKHSAESLQLDEIALRIADTTERLVLYGEDTARGHLIDELDRLVIGVAHDLRSPLNIILNILDTVDLARFPGMEQLLKRVRRRTQRCNWIADTFLGISFNEKIIPTDVFVLDTVVESLEILGDRLSPPLHLSLDIPKPLVVQCNAGLLRLALMHIISNSVEWTSKENRLVIQANRLPSKVHISIIDSSPSIPEANVRKLFTMGFTTKPTHCGLGLYVSKRIMNQQGGDIVYTPNAHGPGSTFSIEIPIKAMISLGQGNLKTMEGNLSQLEIQLKQAREYPLASEQQAWVLNEFKRLTFVFANNLIEELTGIENDVRNLISDAVDVQLKKSLTKIAQNCAYSRLLARNMVEIGKANSPEWQLVSLMEIIEEVLGLLERKMPSDYYHVEWEIDPTLDEVEADGIQLKQVFMNLIRNALDAMPHGGVIKIVLARECRYAVVSVTDSGSGIPKENLPRLFTLGFTTKPKGYGIGLYSAKTIISKHGGTVDVSSRSQGTTFTIHLPIRQEH